MNMVPEYLLAEAEEKIRKLEAQVAVANERQAELWAQLVRAKVEYEPVPFLEVDHDDPMHVKDGIAMYKDWDSSEWFSLFPHGVIVMQRRTQPGGEGDNA